MIRYVARRRFTHPFRLLVYVIIAAFSSSLIIPPTKARAQTLPILPLNLPAPGSMLSITPVFMPPIIRGLTIYPENPFQFDFLVDPGDDALEGKQLESESTKLIKYFLASLTVPEDQMWVNLSPYEKDRIIPENFGQTEMGRDLLAQDYLLKQLSASLMYPKEGPGKAFWDRVYNNAYEQLGTTDIPTDIFHKIWIVPEKAVVYTHDKSVFVVESRLKVMLEEDYLAISSQPSAFSSLQKAESRKLKAPM